tara:strand:- start:268 stop:696 length:429 start_codon:yes stop_codon:yes gene_type:complete
MARALDLHSRGHEFESHILHNYRFDKNKIKIMETVTLVAISVITTLCLGSIVYLLYSVRSLQNKIKTLKTMLSLREKEDENLYRVIDASEKETNQRITEDFGAFERDVEKRFDKSYRTMYEFRDWASEQINRLIEKDQIVNK